MSTARDLAVANRILAHEGVLDAYGHVSVRDPQDPDRFLLSRSLSPELVTPADVLRHEKDGSSPDAGAPLYVERFIHSGVYAARPDVTCVVHAHTEALLPFTFGAVPLQPVIHSASDMGPVVPLWDIADAFGDETDLLVRDGDMGDDLARALGGHRVVLMRGHGFVAAGTDLVNTVRLCVYLARNARVLTEALRLGAVRPLSDGEIAARRRRLRPGSPEIQRSWRLWATRAGVADLLDPAPG